VVKFANNEFDTGKMMTKIPYIIWKDECSVDQNELDSHHYRMFEIINELYELLGSLDSEEKVIALLNEAREYSQTHFKAEEELMRLAHYDGLDEQQQAHRGYIKTLDILAQEDADNLTVLSEDLLQFLKKWWLNHILTIDKKYVPFLKEK